MVSDMAISNPSIVSVSDLALGQLKGLIASQPSEHARGLAVVIVLVALGGTLWAAYCAYQSRLSWWLTFFGGVAVAAIAAQALLGIILGVSGSRPADGLHFVFGPATLLALPIATRVARGR